MSNRTTQQSRLHGRAEMLLRQVSRMAAAAAPEEAGAIESKLKDLSGLLNQVLTTRNRTEEALRRSEELHRLILANMSDAVFLIDDQGALQYVCPNCDTIFGQSREEIMTLGSIRPLLGRDLYDPAELNRTGEIANLEVKVKDKTGRRHILLVNVKQTDIKAGAILVSCRDVTRLRRAQAELEEANTALKVLLRRREEDQDELAQSVRFNLHHLIAPSVEALGQSGLSPFQASQVELIKQRLNDVASSLSRRLSEQFNDLTPRELEVATLIREGRTTKQIAELLGVSAKAIEVHRDGLRRKLGLKHRKINLRSFLLTSFNS